MRVRRDFHSFQDYSQYLRRVAATIPGQVGARPKYELVSIGQRWTAQLQLVFDQSHYFRMSERWLRPPQSDKPYRHLLVFHYGPLPNRPFKPEGWVNYRPNDPVDIRIDNCPGGRKPAHLHYTRPDPHHPQSHLVNPDLANTWLVSFLQSLQEYRETGNLDESFNIEFAS